MRKDSYALTRLSTGSIEPKKTDLSYWPKTSLSLALSAILVLIPSFQVSSPMKEANVVLRRLYAHMFAQAALASAENEIDKIAPMSRSYVKPGYCPTSRKKPSASSGAFPAWSNFGPCSPHCLWVLPAWQCLQNEGSNQPGCDYGHGYVSAWAWVDYNRIFRSATARLVDDSGFRWTLYALLLTELLDVCDLSISQSSSCSKINILARTAWEFLLTINAATGDYCGGSTNHEPLPSVWHASRGILLSSNVMITFYWLFISPGASL